MLHEPRERHRKGARELGDGAAPRGERGYHLPARGIGERGEDGVERLVRILNHTVKYPSTALPCQAPAF